MYKKLILVAIAVMTLSGCVTDNVARSRIVSTRNTHIMSVYMMKICLEFVKQKTVSVSKEHEDYCRRIVPQYIDSFVQPTEEDIKYFQRTGLVPVNIHINKEK